MELSRFVRKQFQVLFHWVFHPSFNLSLTVLVHYRLQGIFSLGRWSSQILPEYLHQHTQEIPRASLDFAYKTFTFFGWPFHAILLSRKVSYWAPTTPR